MKKFLIVLSIIAVIGVAAFFGYKAYYNNQPQSSGSREGKIPQSGDPCGGTGGNGQIISVGNDTIIVKVTHGKNNGSSQFVNLTTQTMIKTSTGAAVLSDLKIGDKVTLVGRSNPDGSFTANIIALCNVSVPKK